VLAKASIGLEIRGSDSGRSFLLKQPLKPPFQEELPTEGGATGEGSLLQVKFTESMEGMRLQRRVRVLKGKLTQSQTGVGYTREFRASILELALRRQVKCPIAPWLKHVYGLGLYDDLLAVLFLPGPEQGFREILRRGPGTLRSRQRRD
jgi:hypothetical protein